MKKQPNDPSTVFEIFACKVSKATGSTAAFSCAFLAILIWAIVGPFFDFSEKWQLVVNTGTTIVTFLMVFLIQKAQNKDSLAIQLKLNELVASNDYSSNRLVDIENMTEAEMVAVQKYYRRLSELSAHDESLQASHSIEEAHRNDAFKDRKKAGRNKKLATATAKPQKAPPKPQPTAAQKKPSTKNQPALTE